LLVIESLNKISFAFCLLDKDFTSKVFDTYVTSQS